MLIGFQSLGIPPSSVLKERPVERLSLPAQIAVRRDTVSCSARKSVWLEMTRVANVANPVTELLIARNWRTSMLLSAESADRVSGLTSL